MVNIQGITTSPYTPQSNGCVQRFNGTLKSVLKKLFTENTNEWDEPFPFVVFAYREVPHEETGFAPFELLYGWPRIISGNPTLLKSSISAFATYFASISFSAKASG
jgi:transposase InsO family protein